MPRETLHRLIGGSVGTEIRDGAYPADRLPGDVLEEACAARDGRREPGAVAQMAHGAYGDGGGVGGHKAAHDTVVAIGGSRGAGQIGVGARWASLRAPGRFKGAELPYRTKHAQALPRGALEKAPAARHGGRHARGAATRPRRASRLHRRIGRGKMPDRGGYAAGDVGDPCGGLKRAAGTCQDPRGVHGTVASRRASQALRRAGRSEDRLVRAHGTRNRVIRGVGGTKKAGGARQALAAVDGPRDGLECAGQARSALPGAHHARAGLELALIARQARRRALRPLRGLVGAPLAQEALH